jgi:hypothetical protein
MNNEHKFLALRKTGGSAFAIIRLTKESYLGAITGEAVDAGLLVHKQMDETRGEFQTRCQRELGLPTDSPIWGESEKAE